MKKLLAMLLAMLMVLSMGSAALAQDDLITIKMLVKDAYDSETTVSDWEKYDVSKAFNAKLAELGLKLEVEYVDPVNFANVVRTRMAAGVDVPDVICNAFDGDLQGGEIVDWGKNGLVLPVNELLDQYDEDNSIREFYNKYVPSALVNNTANDGNLYWFSYLYAPRTVSRETGAELPPYTYRTASIRQDWVEKVGGEMKAVYTPDELFDLLKKFQDQDANGNGVKDEVICVPISDLFNGIADGFGLGTGMIAHVDRNGEVKSNLYDENFRAYLEFMHKLYENGLYDTAAFGADLFGGELIAQNKASITYNYATWTDYEKQTGVETAQYTPFVMNLSGDLTQGWKAAGEVAGGTFNQHFVTKWCKNPEAVVKMFDFIYTEEFAKMMYGTEGLSFEIDENGVLGFLYSNEPTDPAEKEAFRIKYWGLANNYFGLYGTPAVVILPSYLYEVDTTAPENLQIKQRVVAELNDYADYCWLDGGTVYATSTDEEDERINEISETLHTYVREMIADMILGDRPISDLDACIEELEELGLTDYIEIMTAKRARYLEASK